MDDKDEIKAKPVRTVAPVEKHDIYLDFEGAIPRGAAVEITNEIGLRINNYSKDRITYALWADDSTLKYFFDMDSDKLIILGWEIPEGMSINKEILLKGNEVVYIKLAKDKDALYIGGIRIELQKCSKGPCVDCPAIMECRHSGYIQRWNNI